MHHFVNYFDKIHKKCMRLLRIYVSEICLGIYLFCLSYFILQTRQSAVNFRFFSFKGSFVDSSLLLNKIPLLQRTLPQFFSLLSTFFFALFRLAQSESYQSCPLIASKLRSAHLQWDDRFVFVLLLDYLVIHVLSLIPAIIALT